MINYKAVSLTLAIFLAYELFSSAQNYKLYKKVLTRQRAAAELANLYGRKLVELGINLDDFERIIAQQLVKDASSKNHTWGDQ